MEKLKALIVDDEELARLGLRLRLEQHPDVEITAECTNGREALTAINELNPDLMFLDIQMPGIDGFEVVRNLQDDNMPMVIFVTAYDQYAINAFEVQAVDYILKPPDETRLTRALDRARQHLGEKKAVSDKMKLLSVIEDITGKMPADLDGWPGAGGKLQERFPDRITIRDGGGITLVPVTDIDWIDAAGDYMCIHAGGKVHVMRTTMKQLDAQLDPGLFQRIHRSTIVNVKRVREINTHINGEYFLVLDGGMRLKMSRKYKDRIRHIT